MENLIFCALYKTTVSKMTFLFTKVTRLSAPLLKKSCFFLCEFYEAFQNTFLKKNSELLLLYILN